MKTLFIGLGVLAGVVILISLAALIGKQVFTKKVHQEVNDLFGQIQSGTPDLVTEGELADLPESVQRWLRYSGVIGKERIRTVRLRQRGTFRMKPDARWMPFRAVQYYTTEPPGFIWYTTMKPAPLFAITGRDKYRLGRGNMLIQLLSVVPVVNATGPELDQGTLLRYLNEMIWFPSASLSQYIHWEAIDDTSARATMEYKGIRGTAVFSFNRQGEITNMIADRYRDAGGEFILTPWSTPIQGYREFGRIRIPSKGEGVWHLESGKFAYIRLEITDIEYNRPEWF